MQYLRRCKAHANGHTIDPPGPTVPSTPRKPRSSSTHICLLAPGNIWTLDNALDLLAEIEGIPQLGRRLLFAVTMKIMDIPHGEPELEPTRKDKLAVAAFFKDDCLSFNPEERQRLEGNRARRGSVHRKRRSHFEDSVSLL
jgi:hypothetical protein